MRRSLVSLSIILALAGICLRLLFLPSGPEGWDAVDFILALDAYDLARFQPHFPGYPLYVIAAKALVLIGLGPETALRAVNVLAGALLPLPLLGLLCGERSAGGRLLIAFGASLVPGLLVGSTRVEADLPGLLVLLFAFQAGGRGYPFLAGLLAGLGLGFRLGLLPFLAALGPWCALEPRRGPNGGPGSRPGAPPAFRSLRRLAAGLVAGIVLWWVPQLAIVGGDYFRTAASFLHGHFSDWGGSVLTEPDPVRRLGSALRKLGAGLGAGCGMPAVTWPAAAIFHGGGLFCYALLGRSARDAWLVLLAAVGSLGVLILENPERSRHFYPLFLAVGFLALAGWVRSPAPWSRVGVVAGLLVGTGGVILLLEGSRTPPPALRAVRAALAAAGAEESWVFAGESFRLFEWEDPLGRAVVRRARDLEGVRQEINMSPRIPERVLVLSDVAGQEAIPANRVFAGNPCLHDTPRLDVRRYRVLEDAGRGAARLVPLNDNPLPEERPRGAEERR